jgi:hypothetical protein
MFDENLIADDAQISRPRDNRSRVSFKVRLPWYRSLYLSCLERACLSIDSIPIAPQQIYFRLQGHTYRFEDLAKLNEVEWFVLDAAQLIADVEPPLEGGTHDVVLTLFIRIPYHRGSVFRQVSSCAKSMMMGTGVTA